jgi:hypothetical protein
VALTRPSASDTDGSAIKKVISYPLKLLVATTEVLNAAHQLTGFLWTLMGRVQRKKAVSPEAKTSRTVLSSRRRRYQTPPDLHLN